MKVHRGNPSGWTALVIAGVLSVALASCAPEVLPPSQHAPVSSNEVRLYQKQPAKYEALGVVSVPITPEMKWDERGDSTPAFEALKSKAAAMGANGLLLIGQPGTFDLLVTAGYKGEFYQVPAKREPKTAVAQAIFVIDE